MSRNNKEKELEQSERFGGVSFVERAFHKRDEKIAKKYDMAFSYMNQNYEYPKYVSSIKGGVYRKLGIGSMGLPMQLIAVVILILPYILERRTVAISSTSIIVFLVLLFLGVIISYKHKDKHYFAIQGVVFFSALGTVFISALLVILALSEVFPNILELILV